MLEIKKINYDHYYESGCETCDYGSNYVSNIDIYLKNGTSIIIRTSQMYEYTLTESDFMKILSNSEDLKDFYSKLFLTIKNKSYEIKARVELKDMYMEINGEEIDIISSCISGKLKKKGKK